MTFHAANFAAQWAREGSEGSPPNKSGYPLEIQPVVGAFVVDGTGQLAPLTNPVIGGAIQSGPVFCEQIEHIEILVENDEGTPRTFACRTRRGSTDWEIVSDLAEEGTPNVLHNGVFANGGPTILTPNPFLFPNGAIKFDSTALAQFDAGGGEVPTDIIGGTIWLQDGTAQSWSKFSEFVDIPPDSATNQAQALDRLNRLFRNGTGRTLLGTRSDGTQAFALDCAAALMPCSRRIFLRASDIGNQNEQIPAAVGNNTPGHFRFFPGAFFRRTDYIRALLQQFPGAPDANSIIAEGQDFQPYQLSVVQRAPTRSAWRIIVDGARYEIWVDHPAASDFRTALEIWNGLWVPALQTNEAVLVPLAIAGTWTREGVPLDGSQQGLLHRIRYLQYAELLAVSDRQPDITTDTPQDNAGSVG